MKMPEAHAKFIEWAEYYASNGLAVFPLAPGDKKPATEHGCKDATTDARQILRWWNNNPNYNIGIAAGEKSGGLVVIDLDRHPEKGQDGYQDLKEWERLNGQLPETAICLTGSGGYHLYYRDKNNKYANTSKRISPGIDTRGEGGYVVAPPSIHPNGNLYAWEANQEDFCIAEADFSVVSFLSVQKQEYRNGFDLPEAIPEGERTTTLVKLACSMRAKGLSEEAIKAAVSAENEAKCFPPLSDRELEREVFPAIYRYPSGTAPYHEKAAIDVNHEVDELGFREYTGEIGKSAEFPVHCLPSAFKEFTLAVAESVQASADMVAMSVLSAVSAAVAGKYWVGVKDDYVEPLNIYTLLIGRPSERKSPVIIHTCKPIWEYEERYNTEHYLDIMHDKKEIQILSRRIESIATSLAKSGKDGKQVYTMEDLIKKQEELDTLKREGWKELRILFDDTTPEALINILSKNDELAAIISGEAGIFGMMSGRYSKEPNIDIFLKAYTGEPCRVDRVTRESVSMKQPLLTMALAAQPSVVEEVMKNKVFIGRGLTARFLYCYPKSRIGSRIDSDISVPCAVSEGYSKRITELLRMPKDRRILKLTPGAAEVRKSFCAEVEKMMNNELYDIESWAGKLVGNTVRVAGLLHCMTCGSNAYSFPISEKTMRDAVEIGWYLLNQAQKVHDMGATQASKNALMVLQRICEGYHPPAEFWEVNKRDVKRKCRSKKITDNWDKYIDLLISNGYIKEETRKNEKARGSVFYVVNPKYLDELKN